jgi:hypothetical protein
MSKRAVSDEFDGLDAIEKAAVEAALNRCRVLAGQIESNCVTRGPSTSLTSCRWQTFAPPLSGAADVLGQKSRGAVNNTPAPALMGLRARGSQRHR